jgi:hypothetical protein
MGMTLLSMWSPPIVSKGIFYDRSLVLPVFAL